jgi:hypothetical protein
VKYSDKDYYFAAGFNSKMKKQINLAIQDFFSKFSKKNKAELDKGKK